MININNKEWLELTAEDIIEVVKTEEESFYFEFKEDRVKPSKLAEEISALANTYGGYIFLGVSDDKKVCGCTEWTEQRIHVMIHDALSPVPDFDVRNFLTSDEKTVFVIKIEEGIDPPYITSKGKIYERLSSGSFEVKDSAKLTQMYYKKEEQLKRIEEKISIKPIEPNVNNILGYLDMGFSLKASNKEHIWKSFIDADLKQISCMLKETYSGYSISRVGYSVVISLGEVSCDNCIPSANIHDFIEIMGDGSVKLRILLYNNDGKASVNIACIISTLSIFKKIYKIFFASEFDKIFISAYKYEKLAVLNQFYPIFQFDGVDNKEFNEKWRRVYFEHRKNYGNNLIITGDRIPKFGLRVLDKRYLSRCEVEDTADGVIEELFCSQFSFLGYIDLPKD